jgi:hypothetical protein
MTRQQIVQGFYTTWILLSISFISTLIIPDLLIALKPEGESIYQWFSRSGAIMTIFALYAANLTNRLSTEINRDIIEEELVNHDGTRMFKKRLWVTDALVLVLTVVGTIIWGYGDAIRLMM